MACLMLNFLNLKSLVMINFVKFVNFFRALIEKVDITQELKMAGNVTIFSPLNEAFDKLPIKIENQSLSSIRRLILRHFVKGFLFKRDMENGTVSIKLFLLGLGVSTEFELLKLQTCSLYQEH